MNSLDIKDHYKLKIVGIELLELKEFQIICQLPKLQDGICFEYI